MAGIRERFGSEKKAQSPRSSPAAALDSPRPAPPRRKSTTASGAGELWERRQQEPAFPPTPAQLAEAPSALPRSPWSGSPRDGGCCTDLRGRRTIPDGSGSPRRRGGGAAGGVSWEAPAPWAGTGWARGGRGGGGGSLLLARAGPGPVRCSRPTPGQLREAPHPRARPALAAPAAPLPLRSPGPRGVGTRSPQSRHSVARSFPWFSRGDRLPWMLRLMCGQEVAKSCNSRL